MKRLTCLVALVVGCGQQSPDDGIGNGDEASSGIDPTAASESSSATAGNSDSASAGGDDDGGAGSGADVLFDVGSPQGEASCGGGAGTAQILSYIWIANSPESTISKINTQTMIEEGRYLTRPDALGNPSRTSVNLNGNVGVANRQGGVTKIMARSTDCQESNGIPGIQTSSGSDDVLPWEQEECRAWHTELTCLSNRPMAWTQGVWSDSTCRYEDAKLWTSCLDGNPQVMLLDGETGSVEESVAIPELTSMIYGGAVDGDGNFWGSMAGGSQLVRVDRSDFSYEVIPTGTYGYGIAVDSKGRPWLCSSVVTRYDPVAGIFEASPAAVSSAGCMTDGAGTLWLASSSLYGVDTESLELVAEIPLPAYVHGVSIDFEGNVWGAYGANAFRVNPVTEQIDTYDGLNSAYTYSDMTGLGLSQAGNPSG